MSLGRKLKLVAVAAYVLIVHAGLAYFAAAYFFPNFQIIKGAPIVPVPEQVTSTPPPTPLPVPSEFADQLMPTETPPPGDASTAPPDVLMIPVKGVKRQQLQDNFSLPRGDGRTHDAIDIMAPLGTPVLAAGDGRIIKFLDSVAGGITVYQLSADSKFVFYYAHLQRRADTLRESDTVTRGTVIGYVGDTGNAGAGNYHLHFAIAIAQDPKRFYGGPYINPYPLLINGIESP